MLQKQSLRKAIDDYIFGYSAESGHTEKTIRNKKEILERLFIFLNDQEFSLDSCRAFVKNLFDTTWKMPNSRADLVKILRAFVNFLYRRKYISENFAQELIKPKVPRPPLILVSEKEAETIILAGTEFGKGDNSRNKHIKMEMRIALLFILRTGLRISEAIKLEGKDLSPYDDPPSMFIHSKGGNTDLMPMPLDMVDEMKKRQKKVRVFEITEKTCNEVLHRGSQKLGITIKTTCHKLRDIYSLARLRNGNSIQLVSRTLRHSSIAVTDKYYSNYVLTDTAPVLNNSEIIQKNIPTGEIAKQIINQIEKMRDERIKIDISNEKKELVVRIRY